MKIGGVEIEVVIFRNVVVIVDQDDWYVVVFVDDGKGEVVIGNYIVGDWFGDFCGGICL